MSKMTQIKRLPQLSGLRGISFTFYLFHAGVLLLVRQHVRSSLAVAGIGFAITAIIATISWWLIEAPILRVPRTLQTEKDSRQPGFSQPMEVCT
jgi:peptidoglycan/LPS O-acetylase OafA/YrhL